MEISCAQTLVTLLSCIYLLQSIDGKKITEVTEENCEVCLKFMTRFMDSLDSDTKSSPAKIEEEMRNQCKKTKKDDNRFCYYIGGLEESATGMLGEMSKPVSWGMPPNKVCLKLYRVDAQICDLKYDKQIDLATVNLKKLRVGELKAILSDWDDQCRGCAEKSDYIKRIEELMVKYAPEAAEKRAKSEL